MEWNITILISSDTGQDQRFQGPLERVENTKRKKKEKKKTKEKRNRKGYREYISIVQKKKKRK